jgi:hypothetical protein
VLATHLIREASDRGLADHLFDDWEETPLWCPCCGKRRLLGKRMPDGRLWLICKPCLIPVSLHATLAPYRGVRGYAAVLDRNYLEHDRRYADGVAGRQERCCRCGALVPYRLTAECVPYAMHHASAWCPCCRDGVGMNFTTAWQLLASPEGRRFQREHPRLRLLPDREVEVSGAPAIVTSAESMTSRARLEGVFVRATFERIGVRVASGG